MAKPRPTRIVALAASKGGVGKSTLTAALAVRAAQDGNRVAIIDQDPQLSLASWWTRRGKPANPQLFDADSSSQVAVGLIAAEGWDWLFLDTPPSQLDLIESVIISSTMVLIPVRAGYLDLEAVWITEQLCQEHRKPHAFILNMASPGTKATAAVAAGLRTGKRVLLEPFISNRQSHAEAMFAGKTAAEVRDPTAKQQIDDLWAAIQAFASNRKVPA